MKFIVFGASGFVGRHILNYMQSQGYPVLGTQSTKEFPDLIKFNILENSIEESFPRAFMKETEPTIASLVPGTVAPAHPKGVTSVPLVHLYTFTVLSALV